MKTLEDIRVEESPRILIWGAPGVGKTSVASTWPGLAIADCDNNLHVLKSRWYRETHGTPDLVCYETFQDPVDKRTGVVTRARGFNDMIDFLNEVAEMDDVQTIVIDSLTNVQVLAMNLGIELTAARGQSKTQTQLKKHKILVPTQADYGAEMAAFSQLMNQLSALGKTIICVAHEREDFNSQGQVISRSPSLIGSAIRSTVGKWFQEVWYLGTGRGRDNTRVLATQSTNQINGLKSAAFSLPDEIEDPTYTKIMELAMQT